MHNLCPTRIILTTLCFIIFTFSPAFALDTKVQVFTLYPSKPYVKTGFIINPGDSLSIRQEGSASSIYPPDRTIPWVSPAGDPGCLAGPDYTLPGVNCWSLIARIGQATPFLALNFSSQVWDTGELILGINHTLPFNASGFYLVRVIHNFNPPPPPPTTPTPFLDLPWDYQSKGMSFSKAALQMSSYFDHQYPLISISQVLKEPKENEKSVTPFKGSFNVESLSYTAHDGYDYARDAKTKLNEPLLASAPGCARYHYCQDCGHAILIDHGNYYQTRYYHMLETDLITKSTTSCVNVTKGQMIGRVGASGNVNPSLNVDPTGEAGSHLHFMVVEDKNRDGDFTDNIPDGLTDPFGWQGKDPDPWPNYTFTYAGQQRTGNDSHYLWIHSLAQKQWTLTSVGGSTSFEDHTLTFPAGATAENLVINLEQTPIIKPSHNHQSIGTVLKLTAQNLFNNLLTTFKKPFTLTFDFSADDLSYYDPDSLTIYSSSDGQTWVPEPTTIDRQLQIAATQTDHFSYFALIGTLKDITPPTTKLLINGNSTITTTYPSPVNVSLDSQDNPDGLGVEYTLISINDAEWAVYQQPLSFTEPGSYLIRYYSVDGSDNVETQHQTTFKIVNQPPEIILKLNLSTKAPELTASASTQLSSTTTSLNRLTKQIIFTDQASQSATLVYQQYKLLGINVTHLKSIQYNQDPPTSFPDNTHTSFVSKGSTPYVNQTVWIKDITTKSATYDPKQNKTLLLTKPPNQPLTSQTQSGMLILQLNSKEGNLEIGY